MTIATTYQDRLQNKIKSFQVSLIHWVVICANAIIYRYNNNNQDLSQ